MEHSETAVDSPPRRLWRPAPLDLWVLERPGGGGTRHVAERAVRELRWLGRRGVRTAISTLPGPLDEPAYRTAGMPVVRFPVACAPEASVMVDGMAAAVLDHLRDGGVALHGDRFTDLAVAVAVLAAYRAGGHPIADLLADAAEAGMDVTPEARMLVDLSGSAASRRHAAGGRALQAA